MMPVLNFKGKSSVYSYHYGVPFCPLQIDEKKSIPKKLKNGKKENLFLDDNLIIHGDNLHALKTLLPRYAGKVKCIYIDPPYNTGNEGWKYNDNMRSPFIQEWLGKAVGRDDLERHDKWLCMMWPRLQLLKELLSEDGVIFVSIDDNEQHRLRMMMDEVFGEENFITNIIWQKKYSPKNNAKWFSDNHDFIICYSNNAKVWKPVLLERTEKQDKRYKNRDNDPRGKWKSSGLDVRSYQKEYDYPIETPSGHVVYPPKGRCWRCGKEKFKELVKDNRIWFGEHGNNVPCIKRFLSEVKDGVTPLTVWLYDEVGHTQSATQDLKKIGFNEFPSPKSINLLKKIFHIGSEKDSIILDSFAGSGTTAQAVLELNKEDGGNRKFILVECEDYADKITAERVRRVIQGVPKAKSENLKEGLGGTFTYCTLGKEMSEENLFKGNPFPTYKALSSYAYYIATGDTLKTVNENKDFYIGKTEKDTAFFVIYKPNIKFLRSKESALNLDRKEEIQKIMRAEKCKKAIVFAPTHYFDSAAELAREGILFCQLPFAIYKIARAYCS